MFEDAKSDVEPGSAERVCYGSVFGAYCLLSSAGLVLSFMRHTRFGLLVGVDCAVIFAFSVHCLWIAFNQNPPTKKLSSRILLLTILVAVLPVVRLFVL